MEKIFRNHIANFTDLLLDAICMVDASGRFVYVSAACERIFGYTQEEMVGMSVSEMVAPVDRERTLAAAQAIMDGQAHVRFENRYVRKDGSLVDIMWSARWSEADQLRLAVARDITASKHAEAKQAAVYAIAEAAHASEELPPLFERIHAIIRGLLPVSCVAIYLQTDAQAALEFAYYASASGAIAPPPVAAALCEEVLRRSEPMFLPPDAAGATPEQLQVAPCLARQHWIGVPLSTAQGVIGVLAVSSAPGEAGYTSLDQDLLVFVSAQVATAIQRKQLHTRLHFMAQHDELTHLPNRRLFHDRLKLALARAQRQKGRLALLFIDLDRFKLVNDQYGHAAGDKLLQEVARRLKSCVREIDTVARLGGDEFVILLESVTQPENVHLVEGKIHARLAADIEVGEGNCLQVTASIGAAHFPEHGDDMQQLIRCADQAMYARKLAYTPPVN
ncbi:MAG: diguanylate cyclase [Pseudomonadota bacterium]